MKKKVLCMVMSIIFLMMLGGCSGRNIWDLPDILSTEKPTDDDEADRNLFSVRKHLSPQAVMSIRF